MACARGLAQLGARRALTPLSPHPIRAQVPVYMGTLVDLTVEWERHRAAREALAILAAAAPLAHRVRGLIRVGERRWVLALDRDAVVMLPMTDPVDALAAALALHASDALFDRDLSAVDLRLPERPTFRLPSRAVERLNALRAGDLPGEDA